jgi:hypothetical protein
MAITLKEAAADAIAQALRPLVELLIELAVTSPEAESLLRYVYAHVGHDILTKQIEQIRGSATEPSYARIALLTGLHRNEVATKLKKKPRIDPAREQRAYGANRVLSAWHRDARYTAAPETPRVLPLSGKASFEELVQTYAPNVGAQVVLDELVRVRAVDRLPSGEVRARSSSMAVPGLDADGLEAMGVRGRDYLRTLTHNVRHPRQALLDERVMSMEISARAVPLLSRTINNRLRAALQQVETELNDPRFRRNKEDGDERVRVGVGAYFFQEELTPGARAKGAEGSKKATAKRKTAGTSATASGGGGKKGQRK